MGRARLLTLAEGDDLSDKNPLFTRLTMLAPPKKAGQLDAHEFRAVATKALGFTLEEADKLFEYLDYYGGDKHCPPALVTAQDFAWLNRLPTLFNIDAITLCKDGDVGSSSFAWARAAVKHSERQGLQNFLGKASPQSPGSPFAAPGPTASTGSATDEATDKLAESASSSKQHERPTPGHDEYSSDGGLSPSGPPRLRGAFRGGIATKIAEQQVAIAALSLTPRTVGRRRSPEEKKALNGDAVEDKGSDEEANEKELPAARARPAAQAPPCSSDWSGDE